MSDEGGLGGGLTQPGPSWPLDSLSPSFPSTSQAHGSHLRLHQMSVADSGEYVCRANNNIDAREASVMVSVSPNAGNPSGESDEGPGRDQEKQVTVLPGEEGPCRELPGLQSVLPVPLRDLSVLLPSPSFSSVSSSVKWGYWSFRPHRLSHVVLPATCGN